MIDELKRFREKYPMYDNLDDATIADKLAQKYPDAYGGLPDKVAAEVKISTPSMPVTSAEPPDYMGIPAENLTEVAKGVPSGMLRTIDPYAQAATRTALPFVGAAVGAAGGMGGVPLLGPAAPIVGAGLGYAMTKQVMERPKTMEEGFRRIPGEFAAGATAEMGGQSLNALIERYGLPAAQAISNTVKRTMQKLRPRGAPPQLYYDEAETAVKEIIANQGALNLRDEAGNAVAGLPKTVPQFEQAISQTKKVVFNRYDTLAKEAGEQGLNIELEGTAKQLEDFADEAVNKTMAPGLARYARERAAALRQQGSFSPSQAQDAITMANSSSKLKARYDKRGITNPDLTREATVDALEANLLRRQLDDAVTNATGESYQELKNTYGALRSIEDDVRRRAAVQARQNVKGFFDIGEFYSGAELARFLVTADPTALAMSIGAKAPGMIAKYLNQPNRYVKNMFSEVERVMSSPEFQASIPKPEVVVPPTGERVPLPGPGQPPTGIGPQYIIPQTGNRYAVTAEGRLIPVPPMREGTFSPGPLMEESGAPLTTPTYGGQAVRPEVSPGPEPNIGPPPWQAPQIVQSTGVAPELSKIGQPLLREQSRAGTKAVLPPRVERVSTPDGKVYEFRDGMLVEQ